MTLDSLEKLVEDCEETTNRQLVELKELQEIMRRLFLALTLEPLSVSSHLEQPPAAQWKRKATL